MSFYRSFIISTYVTVAIGVLSLGVSEGSIPYLIIGLGGVGCSWYFVEHKRRPFLTPLVATWLMVAAFLYSFLDFVTMVQPSSILDFLRVSQQHLLSFAHFLIFAQVIRLFQKRSNRLFIQLYLVSLVQLGMAATITFSMGFAICFVAYVAVATWTMILYHFKVAAERYDLDFDEETAGSRGTAPALENATFLKKGFFMVAAGMNVSTLFLTLVIFAFFPRLEAGIFGMAGLPSQGAMTGFSDEVRLGDIGKIKKNNTAVMRVKLVQDGKVIDKNTDLLWWGISLAYYDKDPWMWTAHPRDSGESASEHIERRSLSVRREPVSGEIHQSIMLQPTTTNVLFSLRPLKNDLTQYLYPRRGRMRTESDVYYDSVSEAYRTINPIVTRIEYEAFSVAKRPSADELRVAGVDYPDEIRERYTQLPQIGGRVRQLAREVASDDLYPTPYDKAARIEAHLLESYGYTLDLTPSENKEPVEDFLFKIKEGHCQYFAAAMVVMLRCIDIPARVVNGFKGGKWNDGYGGYHIVRQSDAHSWVEVYFPGVGWASFDPTPGGSMSGDEYRSLLSTIPSLMDYLEVEWYSRIIGYDTTQQTEFFRKLSSRMSILSLKLRRAWKRIGGGDRLFKSEFQMKGNEAFERAWLFSALVLIVGGLICVIIKRRKVILGEVRDLLLRILPDRYPSQAVLFYRELLSILRHAGFKKSEYQTPREFARLVAAERHGALAAAEDITELFYRVRFGGDQLSPDESRIVREWLSDMRRRSSVRIRRRGAASSHKKESS